MEKPKCEICGEPMPIGEEMFKYHGYSGDCPKPPLPRPEGKPAVNIVPDGWIEQAKYDALGKAYKQLESTIAELRAQVARLSQKMEPHHWVCHPKSDDPYEESLIAFNQQDIDAYNDGEDLFESFPYYAAPPVFLIAEAEERGRKEAMREAFEYPVQFIVWHTNEYGYDPHALSISQQQSEWAWQRWLGWKAAYASRDAHVRHSCRAHWRCDSMGIG